MSLNIYNDMNLISLVDSMIDKINICWNDPFNPPTVIFPDPLMTNWFKQYWIKHKPVLMNLKFKNLDAFLFKTLNNDRKTKNLTSDILKLKLIDFLNCHSCSGDYNYKKLGGEVIQYLGETEPEPNRMYDFATTVSSLFLKYEISRPEWFLKDEFPDSWQKNLYFDVLNLGIILNECRYATVPELYYAIKKEKREVCDLLSASSSPVFLFGFSAMGQVYRSIIEDLSKNCEIHIFVQAGSNNELAKYGLTHLVAWNRKISTVTDIEPDYELFSAPNKTREVESIHSAICKTLLDKKASNGLMLSDIKVVAPNIGDYLTEINLVFGEPMISDEDVEHKTTKHIPYSILDFTSEKSNTVKAMTVLRDIAQKRYYSASDFGKLIHNPVIQVANGISDEYCEDWTKWIIDMHIYRNKVNSRDWDIGKNRILLSMLTAETISMKTEEYVPYESIGESDSVFKFICFIELLDKWVDFFNCEDNKINLDKVKSYLSVILSCIFTKDEKLSGEKTVYTGMMSAIGIMKLVSGNLIDCNTFLLFIIQSISGISLSKRRNTMGIEFMSFKANRVLPAKRTFFIGFDSNSFPGMDKENVLDLTHETRNNLDESIPSKNRNTFFCQLSSTCDKSVISFVNKDLKKDEEFFRSSVIDSRKNESKIPLDETRSIGELFTFHSLRNKGLYQKKPLPSPELNLNDRRIPDHITISQLRKYLEDPLKFQTEQLFTNYEEKDLEDSEFEPVTLDNLSIYKIRDKYLLDKEFKLKIEKDLKQLIHDEKYRETVRNKLFFQMENIQGGLVDILCPLPDYTLGIFKQDRLKNVNINEGYVKLKNYDSIDSLNVDELSELLVLLGEKKPPKTIKTLKEHINVIKNEFEKREKNILEYNEKINSIMDMIVLNTTKDDILTLQIDNQFHSISGKYSYFNTDYKSTNHLSCIEIKSNPDKNKQAKYYLNCYVSSLALISECQKGEYLVELHLINTDAGPKSSSHRKDYEPFVITPQEARDKLIDIIKAAFSPTHKCCLPIEFINTPMNYEKIIDIVSGQNSPWKYANSTKLLDVRNDLGFNSDNFNQKWAEGVENLQLLLSYLKEKEKN